MNYLTEPPATLWAFWKRSRFIRASELEARLLPSWFRTLLWCDWAIQGTAGQREEQYVKLVATVTFVKVTKGNDRVTIQSVQLETLQLKSGTGQVSRYRCTVAAAAHSRTAGFPLFRHFTADARFGHIGLKCPINPLLASKNGGEIWWCCYFNNNELFSGVGTSGKKECAPTHRGSRPRHHLGTEKMP